MKLLCKITKINRLIMWIGRKILRKKHKHTFRLLVTYWRSGRVVKHTSICDQCNKEVSFVDEEGE